MKTDHSITRFRTGLGASQRLFHSETSATIAFLGGSITEMNGYTAFVEEDFRRNFPRCQFSFINAGISSTCSNTGAFRLSNDILSKGKIDLLFVEFAVNDNQDGQREYLQPEEPLHCSMEGIVRQALLHNPQMDIVFLYTINESHLADYQSGKIPRVIAAHEKVAQYYGLPSLNFAQEVARRIRAGEFDWSTFGGVHPAPFGNRIYADCIAAAFSVHSPKPHPCLDLATLPLLDPNSLIHARLASPGRASFSSPWKLDIPDWQPLPGEKRERFCQLPTLHANTPGAEFSLTFFGNAIGLYLTAGPDAGMLEFFIDNTTWQNCDLYHFYSKNLHYPYTKMLAQTLPEGQHQIRIRIAKERNPASCGHAVRIMNFALNEP
ncbi:MAG: SGNH/GDSL hydrolase family protein [Lentisphaeria bacterium]